MDLVKSLHLGHSRGMKPFPAILSVLIATTLVGLGEEAPKLTIAKLGTPIFSDDFSGDTLGKDWTGVKGRWEVKSGAIVGAELEADHHAGVLNLQKPNHNLVLQFDFVLQGAKGFSLSFNHSKGHLWRVTINEAGAQLRKDLDKKDPNSKTILMGDAKTALEKGKKHTLTAEVVGEKIAVRIGDSISLEGSHAEFDTDKPNIRFVVQGESVVIDNVTVWEAQPAG